MTASEKKRCVEQLHAMETKALKELATMMETANETEHEALELIIKELHSRGCVVWNIPLIERADAVPVECH